MDAGEERVRDAAEAIRLRRQARRIHIESLLAALLLTGLSLLLPR